MCQVRPPGRFPHPGCVVRERRTTLSRRSGRGGTDPGGARYEKAGTFRSGLSTANSQFPDQRVTLMVALCSAPLAETVTRPFALWMMK